MRDTKAASDWGLMRPPRARADCTDFFHGPEYALLSFRGPAEVIEALEVGAVQSRRTFNEQMNYVLAICFGRKQPTVDDPHGVTDWRVMMSQVEFLHDEGPYTIPVDQWVETTQVPGGSSCIS